HLIHLLGRQLHGSSHQFVRISPAAERLVAALVFWITILVFLTVAVRLVGFSGAAGWLDRLVVYLPSLLAGGLIIVSGYVLGTIARNPVSHGAAAADIAEAPLLGHVAQGAFVVMGLVIGLGQVGLDVSFLIILIAIVLAAILGGFALAFGLGARTLVENLVAVRHLKQFLAPGQLAEIGGIRGQVLEFTATGVVLETAQGRRLIPARLCLTEAFDLITREDADEAPYSPEPRLSRQQAGGRRPGAAVPGGGAGRPLPRSSAGAPARPRAGARRGVAGGADPRPAAPGTERRGVSPPALPHGGGPAAPPTAGAARGPAGGAARPPGPRPGARPRLPGHHRGGLDGHVHPLLPPRSPR